MAERKRGNVGSEASKEAVPRTDVFTPEKRSDVMSRVRSCGNLKTELALIRVFREIRIAGWRRKQKVFGKPDFVFRKERIAVFVDGCFWHSCPLHATFPKQNATFWEEKLARNRVRDRLVNRTLRRQGWRVLRIWEHELRPGQRAALHSRLRRVFRNQQSPQKVSPKHIRTD